MTKVRISYDKQRLVALCRQYNIRKLALFGSVVRDDFTDKSDIDVLVEFHQGKTPDLFLYVDIMEALSTLFSRKVDLVTYRGLSKYIRDDILAKQAIQYDEAV